MLKRFVELINEYSDKREAKKLAARAKSAARPAQRQGRDAGSGEIIDKRIRALLAERGPAISGKGGHNKTISVANCLVIGFNLDPDVAYGYLAEWNDGCLPPWSEEELRHKIEDAPDLGGDNGYLLNADRRHPMTADDQRVYDACFTIRVGRWVETYTAGWAPTFSQLLPEEPKAPVDLSDVDAAMKSDKPYRNTRFDRPADPFEGYCPNACSVMMKHKVESKGAFFHFACKLMGCCWCGPRYLKERISWVIHHLTRLKGTMPGNTDPQLYLFTVPRDRWQKAARSIRDQGGDFMWIDVYAAGGVVGETILAVSTAPPRGIETQAIGVDRAVSVMVRAIEKMDRSCKTRWFGHSQPWGDPFKDPPKAPEWEKVGKVTATPVMIEKVLSEYGRATSNRMGSSKHFPFFSMVFDLRGLDLQEVLDDVNAGKRINRPSWVERANVEPDAVIDFGVFAAMPT